MILILVLIIIILLILRPSQDSVPSKYIQKLTRQAARWSVAAKQDESPLISVLHANYGAGYLWALKDIATPNEIMLATGLDVDKLEKEIVTIQDNSNRNLMRLCPEFKLRQNYLTDIAGDA